ncbi:lysophospholipid acyltransferase family protein [Abyssalbus ytuae]|uniref:1-acyl-sn-glycerol-3-phosphate acyltransferase n=1 Tax=Abyssalbus ytuae TaxID=2926907 RepID=A0A9E6ZNX8_9FLAO|nr:lysophospholipid acyltransferase family protein [Abyssalbus ytuae]UOB19439.1 1-acyl-sn-glycerol-3-phosphate acyltransferase [Abyssalbus ytuae]
MRKIISYPLSVIFGILFFLALIVFHPIQWICLNLFGYQAHKTSVDWLQFFLMRCTNVLGTRYSFTNPYKLPGNTPVIIVANHQSMYDIPPLIWYFRKHHPKFISKKELGKGIPSVSFNLKHGGSVLIDRKNPAQAIPAIQKFGNYIETNKRAAVIFPEGTRSKTGEPKPFRTKGLETLIKYTPSACIVPVTINNSWKFLKYGKFPLGIGTHMKIQVHKPLNPADFNTEELMATIEKTITDAVEK